MNLFRVKDIEVEPITKQEFLAGRGTRFGTSNPESFTDPYREKMIRSRMHAYSARVGWAVIATSERAPTSTI